MVDTAPEKYGGIIVVRVVPIDHHRLRARRDMLFSPDSRLGWMFRDRWWFFRPFTEPPPQQLRLPDYLAHRVTETEQLAGRRLGRTLPLSVTAGVVLLLFSACAAGDYTLSRTPIPLGAFLLAVMAAAPGVALTWFAVAARRNARDAYELARRQSTTGYEAQVGQWRARKQAHEAAEYARLNSLPEWGAVPRPAPARRLDVFGGTLWSWEALLTTYGTSTLATQPLLVIDLSREVVCRELVALARSGGIALDAQMLPAQLTTSSLLAGLSPQELIDAVVESMHGGTPEAARAERSMDGRILSKVPYEPGPPPGYRTGPHPADERPASTPPGHSALPPSPPHRPGAQRDPRRPGAPPPGGPPPTFGGRKD